MDKFRSPDYVLFKYHSRIMRIKKTKRTLFVCIKITEEKWRNHLAYSYLDEFVSCVVESMQFFRRWDLKTKNSVSYVWKGLEMKTKNSVFTAYIWI